MSRTFDVTHVSPSIGPFFNLIPGISPQRRNEMEVGSKLRDKSDLVSNRRHYIQTLPRFVLLYFGTPPKRGKSIQPKISVFSEELLKIKKKILCVTFANPGPRHNLYLLHLFHIFYQDLPFSPPRPVVSSANICSVIRRHFLSGSNQKGCERPSL